MKVAILSGSVYGTAEEVARHAQNLLKAAGFETFYNSRAALADIQAFGPEALLAVTSTTGMTTCNRCIRCCAISCLLRCGACPAR